MYGRVQQTQLLRSGSVSARCLDDLEEYTNSSERLPIRSATVESAERDLYKPVSPSPVSLIGRLFHWN